HRAARDQIDRAAAVTGHAACAVATGVPTGGCIVGAVDARASAPHRGQRLRAARRAAATAVTVSAPAAGVAEAAAGAAATAAAAARSRRTALSGIGAAADGARLGARRVERA